MTDAGGDVLERLEAVVRAVPGVTRVYARSAVAGAITSAAARVAPALVPDGPRVRFTDGVVSVTLGTDADLAAPEVAHRVHDAVAAFTAAEGLPFSRAEITIAQVG